MSSPLEVPRSIFATNTVIVVIRYVLYENYFLTSESSSAQLGFSLIFAFAFFALNAISGVSPLSMSSAK